MDGKKSSRSVLNTQRRLRWFRAFVTIETSGLKPVRQDALLLYFELGFNFDLCLLKELAKSPLDKL